VDVRSRRGGIKIYDYLKGELLCSGSAAEALAHESSARKELPGWHHGRVSAVLCWKSIFMVCVIKKAAHTHQHSPLLPGSQRRLGSSSKQTLCIHIKYSAPH